MIYQSIVVRFCSMVAMLLLGLLAISAPSTAAADEAQEEAAKLVKVMEFEADLKIMQDLFIASEFGNESTIKPYAGLVRAFLRRFFTVPAVEDDAVRMLTSQLNESEVRAAIGFYQSPAGKKVMKVLPELRSKIAETAFERARGEVAELRRVMAEEAKSVEPQIRLPSEATN